MPYVPFCTSKPQIDCLLYVTHHAKRDLMAIAKTIDTGQPAPSAQADHGRHFSLLADFLCIK